MLNDKYNCLKYRIIFMSPEYRKLLEINQNYFNYEKSDIFSIGIILLYSK